MKWSSCRRPVPSRVPGVLLSGVVTAIALAAAAGERRWLGHAPAEALPLAIAVGAIVRTGLGARPWAVPGIGWCAGPVLDLSVALLGLSTGLDTVASLGPTLLGVLALLVPVAVGVGALIGRALGLPPRLALLIGCGNAICGNSAVVALAPVLRAAPREVASAITFTAGLGVLVVLGLPLASVALGLTPRGVALLAGTTVCAVPRVLAAAAPAGAAAVTLATLIKLVRVAMLLPIAIGLAVLVRRRAGDAGGAALPVPRALIGFAACCLLHTLGVVPATVVAAGLPVASALAVVAMAALGLGSDLRTTFASGPRVVSAALLSLAFLFASGLLMVHAHLAGA